MGKKQKFTEDQLLEAVVKYASVCHTKIKATELAKWCNDNISGLEEVRDYHFMRPVRELNEKNGKVVERKKICTEKLEEINQARSVTMTVKKNIMLSPSVNIDEILVQPKNVLRKHMADTRSVVNELMHKNAYLKRENESLRVENKNFSNMNVVLNEKIQGIIREQKKLQQQIRYLMKSTEENNQRECLRSIGISDGEIDLQKNVESLTLKIDEVLNIDKVIKKSKILQNVDGEAFETGVEKQELQTDEEKKLDNKILKGLDFS